jgi:hypothetical protein
VSARFEELDWSETTMGVISLRRRIEPSLNVDVYEVKLGDEFLMSSLFTVAEVALARLGLAQDDPRIHSLVVVEALGEVIGWHQRALLPDTAELVSDPRVRLQRGDFFAMADSKVGFDPEAPGRRFHAVLLDIDHTPRHVLHPSHCAFYTPAGLGKLVGHLHPGGVFALWSDDPPDPDFEAVLAEVFDRSEASVVRFPNPLTGGYSSNTVYVAS